MPILPTYQSTAQLQQVQQPNIGRQYGIADVLGAVGQKITAKEELRVKTAVLEEGNRVSRAKIDTQIKINELNARYKGNETAFGEGEYDEELAKIKDEATGEFTSIAGFDDYALGTDLMFSTAKIKADASRITALTSEEKENTAILLDGMSDSETRYIDGNTLVDNQVARGLYTESEGDIVKQKAIVGWETHHANKGIPESESLIKRLAKPQEDPILSKLTDEDIKKLRYDASATNRAQREGEELSKANNGLEFIGGTEFTGTPADISAQVKQHVGWGDITKKEGNAVLGAVAQARGIGNSTNVKRHAQLLANVDSLNTSIRESAMDDSLNYIQRSRGVFSDIHKAYADKELTWDNYQTLLTNARKATSSKDAIISYEATTEGGNKSTNKEIRDGLLAYTRGDETRTDGLMIEFLDKASRLKNPDSIEDRNAIANDIKYTELSRRKELANNKIKVALDLFKQKGKRKRGFDISVEPLKKEKTMVRNGVTYKWDGKLWQPQQ